MFPVVSKLRRSAMKIIYTAAPEVRAPGSLYVLNPETLKWSSLRTLTLSEASSGAPNPHQRALALCVYENELYERAGLEDLQYTLVLGPEVAEDGVRRFRFAVIKGIVFAESSRLQKRAPRPRLRRPLPAGVILDER